MTKLTIEHLAKHFPYGLKCMTPILNENGNIGAVELGVLKKDCARFDLSGEYCNCFFDEIKPILHPLSDLTKETVIGIIQTNGMNITNLSEEYQNKAIEIFKRDVVFKKLQYLYFNELIKKHFDIDGLIDSDLAIDVNTLGINPYNP